MRFHEIFFTPSISTGFENNSCAIADVQKLLLFEGFELMILLIKISMILGPLTNEKNNILALYIIIENEMRTNNNFSNKIRSLQSNIIPQGSK